MLTTDLTVIGVDKILRELNAFDKEAQKVLRRDIREAVGIVRDEAAGYLPDRVLTNYGRWIARKDGRDLSWDAGSARAGLKARSSLKRSEGLYRVQGAVVNTSPITAIFALAGSGAGNSQMGLRIRAQYSSRLYPRALGPAWHRHVDRVRVLIEDAIVKAAAAVGR